MDLDVSKQDLSDGNIIQYGVQAAAADSFKNC